jgi:hypothetical protein
MLCLAFILQCPAKCFLKFRTIKAYLTLNNKRYINMNWFKNCNLLLSKLRQYTRHAYLMMLMYAGYLKAHGPDHPRYSSYPSDTAFLVKLTVPQLIKKYQHFTDIASINKYCT